MAAPALPVSERAVQAIIGWEVTDRATYEATCARPSWPGGSSGVTIGIGYDLGYEEWLRSDWAGHLPGPDIDRLALTCALIGPAARAAVRRVADIVVPWEAAVAVFRARTLPRAALETAAVWPQAAGLPGDCAGALLSLVYNRGGSLAGPRRLEMRQIGEALADFRPGDVPGLIRSMKRLWPETQGLRDRRDGEAQLFAEGLAAAAVAAPVATAGDGGAQGGGAQDDGAAQGAA